MTQPHPDCRAPHKDSHEYVGATHACVGRDCTSKEHDTVPQRGPLQQPPIPEDELHDGNR